MLAHLAAGDDPGDGGQVARRARRDRTRSCRGCSPSWLSCLTVSKLGSGFQIPGVRGVLVLVVAEHLRVLAVRLRTLLDVVAPAHVMAVEQIGEVRPRVDRRRRVRRADVGRAAPAPRCSSVQLNGSAAVMHSADHSETRNRWAGRLHDAFGSNMWSWRTNLLRVGPVVGDLALVVVAHHVHGRASAMQSLGSSALEQFSRARMKPSMLAAVVVGRERRCLVRAAVVDVVAGRGTGARNRAAAGQARTRRLPVAASGSRPRPG